MKMKTIYSMIWLSLFGVVVNGQVRQPHSLYFMETIPQISQMNPAHQPRANGYVMLPNVNMDFLSDLAAKDIFQRQGDVWFSPVDKQYDYDRLWKSIGKKATMFNYATDCDLIGFGFRTGNGYFSFGLSEHVSGNFTLPSDMFKITDNGFPKGTSLDFSPLNTQTIGYMQLRFGYSYKVTDKLTVGLNVKPLFGQFALATKIDRLKLHTGEGELQWDLDAKGNIYSSLPIREVILDEKGKIDDVDFIDFDNYKTKDWLYNYGTGFFNPGIAVDLGATYQIDDRLAVSAALNNLGFISWKEELNGITFDGTYSFSGMDYDVSVDDIDDLFSHLGDSIAGAIDYKIRHDKFKTALAPVFQAGASYQLSKSVSVGLLSRSVFWKNAVRQSFNASVYLQPYSFVSFTAGVTWQVKSNIYLGGGFMFLLGPLQFYLLTDYAPVRYSTLRFDDGDKIPFVPTRQKTFTMRTGVNLVFGRHGYVNKPMLDKGKSSWN